MSLNKIIELISEIMIALKSAVDNILVIIENNKTNKLLKPLFDRISIDKLMRILEGLNVNIQAIERKEFKYAIFGKTSTGKSAIINAMLGDKILPSTRGRTTQCFMNIEGTEDETAYFIDLNNERQELSCSDSLVKHAKLNELSANSCVKVYLPRSLYTILKQNLQIIDSPGFDVDKDINEQIVKYCRDVNVFIYIVDGEKTLEESDRNFLKIIKDNILNPDVLIAINKWDRCDDGEDDDEISQLKQQHLDTVKDFFIRDLGEFIVENDVTFFISAFEALRKCENVKEKQRQDEFNRLLTVLQNKLSTGLHSPNKCKQMLIKCIEFMDTVNSFTLMKTSDTNISELKLQATLEDIIQRTFDGLHTSFNNKIRAPIGKFASEVYDHLAKNLDINEIKVAINATINTTFNQELQAGLKTLSTNVKDKLRSYCDKDLDIASLDMYISEFDCPGNEEPSHNYSPNKANMWRRHHINKAYRGLILGAPLLLYCAPIGATLLGLGGFIFVYNKLRPATNEKERIKTQLLKELKDSITPTLKKLKKEVVANINKNIDLFVQDCAKLITCIDSIERERHKMNEKKQTIELLYRIIP